MEPAERLINFVKSGLVTLPYEELIILDIGFGQPGDFFELFHTNKINRYTGIDLTAEIDCHVYFNQSSISGKIGTDIYSEYISYCTYRSFNPLSYIEFCKTFSFLWETDITEYIQLENTSISFFNFGILSNVLHKIDSKKTASDVLGWCYDNSYDDAYIYLSVMDNEFEHKVFNRDFTYSTEEFTELIKSWNCLMYEENIAGFHIALLQKNKMNI